MASTPTGRRLTELHRQGQLRIGADTVRQMLAAWRVLDPQDLDGSFPSWLRIVEPLIQSQRAASSRLAAGYIQAYRTAEIRTRAAEGVVALAAPAPSEAVATSMLVTGPASLRSQLAKGVQFEKAMSVAQANAAGSAMRHAINGGRETVIDTMKRDSRSVGWARATGGASCSFCALLAGRGPVYSEETVDFAAHDKCSCSAEPVYRDEGRDSWPAGSAQYRELYDEVAAGLPPAEARNAFRTAFAGG
jgi:hypothetical protein